MARKLPVLDTRGALRGDGTRRVIHPADVHGRFATARRALFYALAVVLLSLPWIQVKGNPAVLLDIPARRFFLLGGTFNAQDGALLFFVLIAVAWSLVTVTTLAGRAWCGWACPQTVVLEGLFRPIERLVLGSANQRIAQDAGPLTLALAARKVFVHALWFGASVLIAHAVVSFFVAPRALLDLVSRGPGAAPATFVWAAAFTAAIYLNFAWFREQTCLIVCPYGRLQSALVDKDSMTVGYDARRGEPRARPAEREGRTEPAGDCVDCQRCVLVCPTAIDIRNGPQYDCIGCTACIDACDEVMDKLGRPRGLVRYDSLRGLAGEPRRILRPRLAFYLAIGAVLLIVGARSFRARSDFSANVLRAAGAPYVLEGETVRNTFDLHLVNKRNDTSVYVLEGVPRAGTEISIPIQRISLGPFADRLAPVLVVSRREASAGSFMTNVRVRREGAPPSETITVHLPCLGPGR